MVVQKEGKHQIRGRAGWGGGAWGLVGGESEIGGGRELETLHNKLPVDFDPATS